MLFAVLLTAGEIFLFTSQSQAQQEADYTHFLLLDKPGSRKRIKYYKGDEISVKVGENNFFTTGIIDALDSSSVVVDGLKIPLDQITAVYNMAPKRFFRSLSKSTFLALIPMAVLSPLDYLAGNEKGSFWQQSPPRIMGGFAVLGILFRIPGPKKYKFAHRWRLRYMDLTP